MRVAAPRMKIVLDNANVRIAVAVTQSNQIQRIGKIMLSGFLFRRHVRKELHPEPQLHLLSKMLSDFLSDF